MKLLKFHQSTGFTPADFPNIEGTGDTWITNAGFDTAPVISDGTAAAGYQFKVYAKAATGSETHKYRFLARIIDPNFTQEVLLNTEADLLALRLQVAALLLVKT